MGRDGRSLTRSAVLLTAVLPLAAGACASGAPEPSAAAVRQCERRWDELGAYHGENGNPGAPGRVLERRWQDLYSLAADREEDPEVPGCAAEVQRTARKWDRLEAVMYDLADYDLAEVLPRLERDRRHRIQQNRHTEYPTPIPRRVEAAFATLRTETPLAQADLEPALQTLDRVDLSDAHAVAAALADVVAAADASVHYQRARRAIRTIENAELDEE